MCGQSNTPEEGISESRHLRILYVTACGWGGVATYVGELAAGLTSMGQEVSVAGPSGSRLERSIAALGSVTFYPLTLSTRPSPLADLAAIRQLRALTTRQHWDVIHSNGLKAGLLMACVRPRGSTCFVYGAHGTVIRHSACTWTARPAYALEKWAARRHDMLIAGSHGERSEFADSGMAPHGKVNAIYYGVPPPDGQYQAGHYRRQFGLDGNCPVICGMGTLHRSKGFDCLIQSMALVTEKLPEARALIAGDGRIEAQLKSLVRSKCLDDQVRFVGYIDDCYELLADADAFVLSSRWEGLPLVLIMAGMMGKPVVATDVGSVKELVDDQTGWLVPMGDADALASAILECLTHREDAAQRAGFLHQRVVANCNLDAMVRRTLQAYKEESQP